MAQTAPARVIGDTLREADSDPGRAPRPHSRDTTLDDLIGVLDRALARKAGLVSPDRNA